MDDVCFVLMREKAEKGGKRQSSVASVSGSDEGSGNRGVEGGGGGEREKTRWSEARARTRVYPPSSEHHWLLLTAK